MSGVFGYELDLTKLSTEERLAIAKQVALFKEIRRLVQFGDFYRLRSPFQTQEGAWSFVSRDKSEAFVMYMSVRGEPNPPVAVLKLAGLDPDADYEMEGTGARFGGDYLMNAGLAVLRQMCDLESVTWRLRRV